MNFSFRLEGNEAMRLHDKTYQKKMTQGKMAQTNKAGQNSARPK